MIDFKAKSLVYDISLVIYQEQSPSSKNLKPEPFLLNKNTGFSPLHKREGGC